jgi:hypothetical protein
MAHAAVAAAVGPHPDCPVAAFHGHPRAGTLFEFRQQWFTEMQLKNGLPSCGHRSATVVNSLQSLLLLLPIISRIEF